jgi:FtsH-binding integral membrane protein
MSNLPNSFGASRDQFLGYESRTDTMTMGRFFNTVYAWMATGLALTAVVGWYVAHSSLVNVLYASPGIYTVIALAAFGLAWYVQSQVQRQTTTTATILFLVYAAVIGALISGIYLNYPAKTLAASFLLTGGTFGAMSIYGFVTKRDLTRNGSICVMLALGFIVASFVNIWLANSALSWVITYAILILFVGITAYETQRLKRIALQMHDNPSMASRYAIVGSLVLYISFINLFLSILRIMGSRR